MKKEDIRELRFGLNGNANLLDSAVLSDIIKAIESNPVFSPEFMGFSELQFEEYSNSKILECYIEKMNFGLFLKRKKQIKYFGEIGGAHLPKFAMNIDKSISKKNIENLFYWADAVSDAFKPDAGALSLVQVYTPPTTQEDMKRDQTLRGSWFSGNYRKYGPLLGMYTWLGPHFVNLIGLDNLKATPQLTIEEKPWGGVKMILGETDKPWEMEATTYIDSWHAAMEHLWQFGVFCDQEVKDLKVIRSRGENCTIPRMDGKFEKIL